ncbi:MAG: hypothetical protein JSV33_04725 [bacterium]|nr:MAG: hypothetical protein JSV33_04725 [bacterium]
MLRHKNINRIMVFSLLVIVAVVLFADVPALAQRRDSYDVRHFFRLTPQSPITIYAVWRGYYCHAFAIRGERRTWDVNPALQGASWRPYGWDFERPMWVDNPWGWPCNCGWAAVPPAGHPWTSWVANASVIGARGTAYTGLGVSPYVPAGPVSGIIRSWGEAVARWPGRAYAFSWNQVGVVGVSAGGVVWGPHINSTSGRAQARGRRRRRDPIVFNYVDEVVTDSLVQVGDTLLLIDVEIGESSENDTVDFDWDDNMLYIGARDVEFGIDLDGMYTDTIGSLYLKVEDGEVTDASASGFFGGVSLPSIGETVPLSFSLDTLVEFDYTLPSGPVGTEPRIDFGGGGTEEPPDTRDIPTITHWGVILLLLLLIAAGTFVIIRRRAMLRS